MVGPCDQDHILTGLKKNYRPGFGAARSLWANRPDSFASSPRREPRVRRSGNDDLVINQLKAKATKPEQSRTKPATVTARKLLEANSSRMVHHLSCAPGRRERLPCCTVKEYPPGSLISLRADTLAQHQAHSAKVAMSKTPVVGVALSH
jgi:hypothetical protein